MNEKEAFLFVANFLNEFADKQRERSKFADSRYQLSTDTLRKEDLLERARTYKNVVEILELRAESYDPSSRSE